MISRLPIVLALGHRFASLELERSTLSGVADVLDGNTMPAGEREDALRTASIVMLGTGGRLEPSGAPSADRQHQHERPRRRATSGPAQRLA